MWSPIIGNHTLLCKRKKDNQCDENVPPVLHCKKESWIKIWIRNSVRVNTLYGNNWVIHLIKKVLIKINGDVKDDDYDDELFFCWPTLKELSLIFCQVQCQRSTPSQISDTPRAEFPTAQNMMPKKDLYKKKPYFLKLFYFLAYLLLIGNLA